MARTVREEIEKILNEPIGCHPSREDQEKIKRLEKAVIRLADLCSQVSGRI